MFTICKRFLGALDCREIGVCGCICSHMYVYIDVGLGQATVMVKLITSACNSYDL